MIKKAILPIFFCFSLITFSYAASMSVNLVIDKPVCRAGEPVKITITVANQSPKDADLLFGSGQNYDIMITDKGGHDIWHWSHGKVFTMAVRHVKIPPGQNIKYTIIWKQLDNKRLPVKRGRYFIRGRLMSAEQLNSPRKTIVIK
jgi:hypothetical protein